MPKTESCLRDIERKTRGGRFVYVLFGAGEYAKFAIDFLGRQNIKVFY